MFLVSTVNSDDDSDSGNDIEISVSADLNRVLKITKLDFPT